MIKFVGFDKDGTLLDSMKFYIKEWGQIINADFDIDPKDAEKIFIDLLGQPTVLQLKSLLEKNDIKLSQDELFEKANEIARKLGERSKAKPFAEIKGVLKKLKQQGYKIFVSSGQQESVVKKDLQRTGLIKYIDFIVGIRPNKPGFKKGELHFRAVAKHFGVQFDKFKTQAVFIGDAPADIEISKESGITSIVRKSSISQKIMLDKGAKAVLKNFDILPKLLLSL